MAHRSARDAGLKELAFPYPDYRSGQRQLAEAVYKAAARQRTLLVQAPTGIGKTVGSLFPMLKACAFKKLDKIFFLTAKTSGRRVALDALGKLRNEAGAPLRVVELVARDKACEHPDKACHGDSCPLSNSFYDRLPDARNAALSATADRTALRTVALEHGTLDQARLKSLRNSAPPSLKKSLDRLNRSWNALCKDQEADYQVYAELPDSLGGAIHTLATLIADFLAEHAAEQHAELRAFYFDLLHFSRLAEGFGSLPSSTSPKLPRKTRTVRRIFAYGMSCRRRT